MRPSMKLIKLILVVALVGLGCKVGSPATPTVEEIVEPTADSAPADDVIVTATAENPAAATPRSTERSTNPTPVSGQTYSNPEMGVTLTYPEGWQTEPGEEDSSVLTYLISPDQQLIGLLLMGTTGSEDTLESIAALISQSVMDGLLDVELLVDEAIQLADEHEAWQVIATARRDDGSEMKISLTIAIQGARAFTLLVFGEPEGFDDQQPDLLAMAGSLHLETPQIYGLSRDQTIIWAGGESTNPRDYDPATAHGGGDALVFSGLVALDPNLNLTPDLAATWEVADGVVYTFHLRPDARFHNGKPVTAQDVIYSWERAADPETDSDIVLTYLGDIVGVKEMRAGEADHISGLKALDDHTLQVTIDAPKPYFLLKLTYSVAYVLDQENVESGPEWYRTPNGSGPYRLKQWDSFKVIIYERNDDYYLEPPAIPNVVVLLYSGVGLRLYEAGEIDVTGISYSSVPRMLDPEEPMHDELLSGVNMCTSYVVFDVNQPPFDDVKVRQAFSMAFDRQKYLDVVMNGIGLMAKGPFPPGLPGYNTELEGLAYDPERARQLLAESKYGGPEGLPPIVYTDAGLGSDQNSDVAAMIQMWEQELGVTITVENLEPNHYLDNINAGIHGQIFSTGWCADYPDPENFADVLFHSEAEHNYGHYANPEVDALLEQARVEQDATRRIQLYQQVEQIIVDDAPALFVSHSVRYALVKPYIQGYVLTPIGIPLDRYLWIDPSKIK